MKQMLVTYTTMPERTEENTRLVRSVFAELHARAPQGIRYTVLCRDDGTFLHLVRQEEGAPPLSEFESFRTFQQAASERWRDKPVVTGVKVVGSYGTALLAD
jgi:hypothetical protein